MSADWIKMRTDLYRAPKVIAIADSLLQPRSDLARYVTQNLQCDMAFPAGFKRCHINNQAASCISAFAKTDNQNVVWNFEVFNSSCQNETIWRNYTYIRLAVDKTIIREILGINDGAVDIGKNFELIGAASSIAK